MDRDRRLTGSLRGQTDNVEAPLGFELNNPWRVSVNPFLTLRRFGISLIETSVRSVFISSYSRQKSTTTTSRYLLLRFQPFKSVIRPLIPRTSLSSNTTPNHVSKAVSLSSLLLQDFNVSVCSARFLFSSAPTNVTILTNSLSSISKVTITIFCVNQYIGVLPSVENEDFIINLTGGTPAL